jgi:hypothetical protein
MSRLRDTDISALFQSIHAMLDPKVHEHECDRCHTVWDNDEREQMKESYNHRKAHQCPKCGDTQYWKRCRDNGEVIYKECPK